MTASWKVALVASGVVGAALGGYLLLFETSPEGIQDIVSLSGMCGVRKDGVVFCWSRHGELPFGSPRALYFDDWSGLR